MTAAIPNAFALGWNRHDADVLMSFMTDDRVFETSAGPGGPRQVSSARSASAKRATSPSSL
jgi:hypothetical protein